MNLPILSRTRVDPMALADQYSTAIDAVSNAMAALQAINCDRQLYSGNGLIGREEMDERDRKLSTIRNELRVIHASILRQHRQQAVNP